jgi:hypothetical protein
MFPSTVYKGDFGALEHVAERVTRAQGVLERLIQQRRREPKKDLISILSARRDRNHAAARCRSRLLTGVRKLQEAR